MAEEQQHPEGSAEAFAEALKSVPCDEARAAAPDLHERFDSFARQVYPHVLATSKQYMEMEMVWHAAYLDFLEILVNIVAVHREEVGSDIIQVIKDRAVMFIDEYATHRGIPREEPK
jgi:hypothetical protein